VHQMDDIIFEAAAPSPDGGNRMITLAVDAERVRQLATSRRTTALFELIYNVLGKVPPVNNIGYHEKSVFPDNWGGMIHTHAIFKGLKRPMNDHELDGAVYVYLMSPRFTYRYIADMACTAKRFDAPKDSIFAVYVIFEDNNFDRGSIVNWEWVSSDRHAPRYPRDYKDRYEQRVWTNG